MNVEYLKKDIGKHFRIRPIPERWDDTRQLDSLDDQWSLDDVTKRKLPRQGDSVKGELPAVCRALNRDGGTRPKVSCGRSSLYSRIHCALISRT